MDIIFQNELIKPMNCPTEVLVGILFRQASA
jgi:hypothetical protein